ncbi:MAG TPA: PH domain-containing protein [Chitinophagales bacterium]|nr:PH domain-containing protein [Chitinophagales bacterium]
MAKCGNCSKSLEFINSIGSGSKVSTGERLCQACFGAFAKIHPAGTLGKYTLAQAAEIINAAKGGEVDRITAQLQKIGISKELTPAYWQRGEVYQLDNIIGGDEEIFAMIQAAYSTYKGLLVATNKRLIFIEKTFTNLKVEDFGLDKITSIQYQAGFIDGEITIIASGNTAKMEKLDKNLAQAFAEKVRAKLSEPKAQAAPVTVVNQPLDVADQLGKLAKLKEQGILTQEEFDAQKKKLLGL